MIEYKFSSKFVERFRDFLYSGFYRDVNTHAKSDYWKHHADTINIHISGNKITVDGDSGFNIPPPKKNRTKYLISRILNLINNPSSLIPLIKRNIGISQSEIKLLNYFEAFDKVMTHDPIADPDLSPYRINFRKLKEKQGVIASVEDMQRNYFARKKYKLTDSIVMAYYYYNILHGYTDITRIKTILEIGAGNGNLLSLLSKCTNNTIIDVDLPEMLSCAILYISDLFPKAKILIPHEAKSDDFNRFDFVFLTPKKASMIKDNSVDLTINTNSFQEMRHKQIEEYFQLIQRVGKNDSYFFTSNKVEKIPCSPDCWENESAEPPNRFSEYPWNPVNKTLIYEISRLTRLVQLDNTYIRLEQIKK